MPFLLPELLNFQGSAHLFGVGSFSYIFVIAAAILKILNSQDAALNTKYIF